MKKNRTLLAVMVLALVMVIGGSSLFAQKGDGPKGNKDGHCENMKMNDGPGPHDDGDRMMMMERDLIKQIGLSKDQEAKIEALGVEHQKANVVRESDIKLASIDLKSEMDKDKIDMNKVTELADKISKAKAEQTKSRILHMAQVANVMTKEQRDQLEKLRAERRHQMMERFHNQKDGPMKKGKK